MGLGGMGARGVEEGGGNLKGVAFIDIKGGGLIVFLGFSKSGSKALRG